MYRRENMYLKKGGNFSLSLSLFLECKSFYTRILNREYVYLNINTLLLRIL